MATPACQARATRALRKAAPAVPLLMLLVRQAGLRVHGRGLCGWPGFGRDDRLMAGQPSRPGGEPAQQVEHHIAAQQQRSPPSGPEGEACTRRQLWFMRCDRRRCSCALKARSWMMTLASRFSDRLSGSRLLEPTVDQASSTSATFAVQRAVAVFVNAHPGAQQVVIQQRRGRAHDGHVGLALQDQRTSHRAWLRGASRMKR